jgi:VCBS repeat-containing protein
LSITIQGSNDAPVAVADVNTAVEAGGVNNATAGTTPTGNVLTNDTDVDAGESRTVSGVAAGVVGSASTNVGSTVTGSYGTINISSTGAYTYAVDNSNATVQALRTSAQTINDVFTYTVTDTGGLTGSTQITITIQGVNDAPAAVLDAQRSTETPAPEPTSVVELSRVRVTSLPTSNTPGGTRTDSMAFAADAKPTSRRRAISKFLRRTFSSRLKTLL